MSILRVQNPTEGFSILQNHFLKNEKLSMKAKGLLAYLLSLPHDWEICVREVIKHFPDGKHAVYSALTELGQHGYVVKETTRQKSGTFARPEYVVSGVPIESQPQPENQEVVQFLDSESPHPDFPDTDNRDPDNQPQQSIKQTKKEINKKQYNKTNSQNDQYETEQAVVPKSSSQSEFVRDLTQSESQQVERSVAAVTQDKSLLDCSYERFVAGVKASLCHQRGFGHSSFEKGLNAICKLIREGRWQTPKYAKGLSEPVQDLSQETASELRELKLELNSHLNAMNSPVAQFDIKIKQQYEKDAEDCRRRINALHQACALGEVHG